mgnify:CR=1 FL=1
MFFFSGSETWAGFLYLVLALFDFDAFRWPAIWRILKILPLLVILNLFAADFLVFSFIWFLFIYLQVFSRFYYCSESSPFKSRRAVKLCKSF